MPFPRAPGGHVRDEVLRGDRSRAQGCDAGHVLVLPKTRAEDRGPELALECLAVGPCLGLRHKGKIGLNRKSYVPTKV